MILPIQTPLPVKSQVWAPWQNSDPHWQLGVAPPVDVEHSGRKEMPGYLYHITSLVPIITIDKTN